MGQIENDVIPLFVLHVTEHVLPNRDRATLRSISITVFRPKNSFRELTLKDDA